LPGQGDKAGGRQHEADVDLCPFLSGEIDRNERPEAGLDVGNEKDEPVEPAQAPVRRTRRWFARGRLRCGPGGRRMLVRPLADTLWPVAGAP
jgi:hypothetical protein